MKIQFKTDHLSAPKTPYSYTSLLEGEELRPVWNSLADYLGRGSCIEQYWGLHAQLDHQVIEMTGKRTLLGACITIDINDHHPALPSIKSWMAKHNMIEANGLSLPY